ncbi:MAG: hypothetical protein ACK4VP_00615 [Nitrospira sp.]
MGEAAMWESKRWLDQPNGESVTILSKDVTFKEIAHFEGVFNSTAASKATFARRERS